MARTSNLHPDIHAIKFERTFCMVKPDGVMRGLVGEIILRLEKAGLKVVAMKMTVPTDEQVKGHLPWSDEVWVARLGQKGLDSFELVPHVNPAEVMGTDDKLKIGREVVDSLFKYLKSGPVVCMVVEGIQAIEMVRKLAGHTLPFKAAVGTIRGDFSVDSPTVANVEKRSIHNLFHASENKSEAENEIKVWFGDEPIYDYDLGTSDMMYGKYY
jgi:nucleoside-diphosphate kinase